MGFPAPGTLVVGDGGARGSLVLVRGRWSLGVCGLPNVPEVILDCLKGELWAAPPSDELARGGKPS
jgi:hypothetical protein